MEIHGPQESLGWGLASAELAQGAVEERRPGLAHTIHQCSPPLSSCLGFLSYAEVVRRDSQYFPASKTSPHVLQQFCSTVGRKFASKISNPPPCPPPSPSPAQALAAFSCSLVLVVGEGRALSLWLQTPSGRLCVGPSAPLIPAGSGGAPLPEGPSQLHCPLTWSCGGDLGPFQTTMSSIQGNSR